MSADARDAWRLDGRVALVTGGGTGIGRGVAEALVAAGARVAIAGRRPDPLDETVRSLGGERVAVAISADVTVAADRRLVLERVESVFGRLDTLVNNAGSVDGRGPVENAGDDAWRRSWEVNVVAPFALARAALPLLRANRGSIVNVSTGAALAPVPGFGVYGAAKAGMNHASCVLAVEAAPDVRVNVVCPGGVDTEIFEKFLDGPEEVAQTKKWYAQTTPLGRIGTPPDIAPAVVFLASDAAAWITGAVLPVGGGLHLV